MGYTRRAPGTISELARMRALAGYGYDTRWMLKGSTSGITPTACGKAERHHAACSRLLEELFGVE